MTLAAPFPWFGGKSRAAPLIWERLGAVDNYVEPFAGSLAVLLGAPRIARTETINDKDGFVANFWRATSRDPQAVAEHADWPVNEFDLTARHLWLVNHRAEVTARIEADPDYFDAKVAGWWCWGLCCWIGSGWCSGAGPWVASEDGRQLVHLGDAGRGVNRQRVHLGDTGRGVNRKRVHLGNAGQGVNRQRVHLGNAGQGVNRKRVHLGPGGNGMQTTKVGDNLYRWIGELGERLRRVRVCCGDWQRVCGPTPTVKLGLTGVVLDPPYSEEERTPGLYSQDSNTVAAECREWALSVGDDPRMRIVLCGYDTEHEMPGWTRETWTAHGGYGSQGDGSNENKYRETLWFSPHCLNGRQGRLFG